LGGHHPPLDRVIQACQIWRSVLQIDPGSGLTPQLACRVKGMEIFIRETHRGLWYEDGVFKRVLTAGRYKLPRYFNLGFWRNTKVEVQLVDVRERELTIKGQEILSADKVALRVSIVVQFRVTDPQAALHTVESYQDRLYSDVQLAARRSLASMSLEEILTHRNRLSDEILQEVKESATNYGVAIFRANVKDLIFPGNLQEIMNKVLAAERVSQARLIEARTQAEVELMAARTQAEIENQRIESDIASREKQASSEAKALATQAEAARAYSDYPALLRLRELETLSELAKNAQARIYIGFDKHLAAESSDASRPEA